MANYDPRTGKKIKEGVTQDFSNFKGALNFDTKTGNRLNTSISSDLLQNTKPINLTQPKPSVGVDGMNEEITSLSKNAIDRYTKNLQDRATITETGKNTALDSYIQNLMGQKGETELKTDAYSKTVDPLESELIDINNQIMAEENANRRRIQAIEKNQQGMLVGAVNDEIDRVNRESLAKRADLSIIQMGIQGKYDSAKAIADRAISVQLERQRNLNEALKINYEEKKELFTTAEKRAFESAQADRERELNREENNLKEISDLSITALQNGAPSSIAVKMRQAKTPEEAIRIGGSYIMSLSDRIKMSELNKVSGGVLSPDELKDLPLTIERTSDKIATIDSLLSDNIGLASNAGALRSGKILPPGFANQINDWRAKAINVVQKLTVDELGRVKTDGVTFGQLSNGERQAVGDAASALSSAMIYSGKGDDKRPRGSFRMSQDEVKRQFGIIQKYIKLDFERRTGINYDEYQRATQQKSFQVDPQTGNLLLDIPVDDNMFWGVTQ